MQSRKKSFSAPHPIWKKTRFLRDFFNLSLIIVDFTPKVPKDRPLHQCVHDVNWNEWCCKKQLNVMNEDNKALEQQMYEVMVRIH